MKTLALSILILGSVAAMAPFAHATPNCTEDVYCSEWGNPTPYCGTSWVHDPDGTVTAGETDCNDINTPQDVVCYYLFVDVSSLHEQTPAVCVSALP